MRRTPTARHSNWRRMRWLGAGVLAFFLFMFIRGSGKIGSGAPATVEPHVEQKILAEPSLAADCSDWQYLSMSPSRDTKLLTAQFFLPYNLSFTLIGPRADRASLWGPQNVRSICTVRPKAHGMQAYSVFCPLNTTEDKYRADARGEMMVSLQVDDVMFRKVPVCKESNVVSRRSEAALCAFVSASDEAWLEQWLEYHSMMGIDTFYLYEAVEHDRSFSRTFAAIASSYGDSVQWKYFTYYPTVMKTAPERARVAAYNDCWMRHRNSAAWLGFLQVQDFIYSPRGVDNVTALLRGLGDKNSVELMTWPMQENPKEPLSPDHIRESKQLSHRLMIDKYQFRRDYPAGSRAFVRPSLVEFVGDSRLQEVNTKEQVATAKIDLEVLSYTVERDGFDAKDPARWQPFPKPAAQLAKELSQRLRNRVR